MKKTIQSIKAARRKAQYGGSKPKLSKYGAKMAKLREKLEREANDR